MNDDSTSIAVAESKVEVAQETPEWSHHNGNIIAPLEKTLDHNPPAGLQTPPMFVHKKAKRKDDGPLEIFCGWIVDHQLGMSAANVLSIPSLINY